MRHLSVPSLVFASLALVVTACPEEPPASTPCKKFSDCPTGQLCTGGACAACADASACEADYGAGATCTGGRCAPATCVDGQLGCACLSAGGCEQGECVGALCVDCQRGALDCTCFANGSCDQGLRCNAGVLCEVCPEGELNCACPGSGTCDDPLVCDNGVCTTDPCPRGSQGCPCDTGDTCDGTLYCDDNTLCQVCVSDVEDCPCDAGDTCQGGLVCDASAQTCRQALLCVELSCGAHRLCQERTAGVDAVCLDACDVGFRFNGSACDELTCASGPNSIAADCAAQNRACTSSSGAGAVCGTCLAGFVDDSGTLETCRAVRTCTELDCSGQHRECQAETTSADAACLGCVAGYLVDGNACVVQTCATGGPGSILASCTAAHRVCTDPFDAPASCGACTGSYLENSLGECQLPHSCDVSDLDCAAQNRRCEGEPPLQHCGDCLEGTAPHSSNPEICAAPITCRDLPCAAGFCVEGAPGQNATCITAQCGANEARSADNSTCISCVSGSGMVSCNATDTGETGRTWPVALANGHCLCETRDDFYWDEGDRQAKPCDDDGDGWVRESARSAVQSTDLAMRHNARCRVRSIDRFVLLNELGQRLPVYLCAGTPAQTHIRADCAGAATVALYESVRNDNQDAIELDPTASPYWRGPDGSEVGRRLRASEINGLTRACISEGADYNHNGVADLREWHGMPAGTMSGDQVVLAQFGYFVELHRGWYERGTESYGIGQYVIAERSRCASDFFAGYPAGASAYWKSCTRSRDAAYNGVDGPTAPDFGLDFARWSCEEEQGGCPIPPPPTDAIASGAIPEHGLCRSPALPPPIEAECQASSAWPCVGGQVWRGMSHHSQFRCVLVRQSSGPDTPTLPQLDFAENRYAMNLCRVDCPVGDASCSADCGSGVCATTTESAATSVEPSNPSHAKLRCDVGAVPLNGTVGLAAVAFDAAAGAYQRGCVDEWAPTIGSGTDDEVSAWRSLCPGWVDDPAGSVGQGDPAAFGQLQCGCGNNYGGPNCDLGCPDAQLSLSEGYSATPRDGYWMCADFTTTSYSALDTTFGPALVGHDASGATYIMRDDLGSPVDGQALCENAADCATGFVIR